MITKRIIHIACCLSVFVLGQLPLQAQRFFAGRMEFGFVIGGANYHGDLAREIVLDETHLMGGIYYERNFNEWFSLRTQLSYGKISGSDANFSEFSNRNLSFYSHIAEGAVMGEFNFQPFGINPNLSYISPYVFTGLAFFHFNPKTEYNGEEVQLRRLGTEGQGLNGKKRYSLLQPAVPLGFGIKIKSGRSMLVGVEVGFRKTWTDYLDDVKGEYPDYNVMLEEKGILAASLSHRYKETEGNYTTQADKMRGDPHLNDWYFFMNLRIGYKFGRPGCANERSF
jgi:hypothetical protein